MNDTELAHRAISIADRFDWWWSMEDGASYKASKAKAETSRDEFAATVYLIKDSSMRELLKDYWRASFEATRPFLFSKDSFVHSTKAEEIMSKILDKISDTANTTI